MTTTTRQAMILGLLAETFVHPGSGQEEGESAVDLPVARERTTHYPFVPGSGVKGALRDKAWLEAYEAESGSDDAKRKAADEAVMPTYGSSEEAGGLLFSDAKLMLLPVRSLTSPYVWLTCPHLLERYRRDCERLLGPRKRPALPELKPTDEKVLVVDGPTTGLFLEELVLTVDKTKAPEIGQLADALATLVADDAVKKRLGAEYTENDTRKRDRSQLAVVSDASFTWFARHGLPVMARNVLDEHKVSRNLWYEEALPPDTLLYTLVSERKPGPLAKIRNLLDPPYLQLGGNETVGQGWLKVAFGPGTQP